MTFSYSCGPIGAQLPIFYTPGSANAAPGAIHLTPSGGLNFATTSPKRFAQVSFADIIFFIFLFIDISYLTSIIDNIIIYFYLIIFTRFNMNNIGVFLNNRTVSKHFLLADLPVRFGDWCLTPVRCLFDGNKVVVGFRNTSLSVDHEKEYSAKNEWSYKPKRNFLRVVASIVLLIPGLIIGSAFKGLGFLSQSIRTRHRLAVIHFTPVNLTIGSQNARLNLDAIKQKLLEFRTRNQYNQPTNLVVFAEEGTFINEDPGFISLNPQKIILDGARIIHAPSAIGRLDETLCGRGWDRRAVRNLTVVGDASADKTTFVTQWKVKSVNEAILDAPPKLSLFSFERLKRVYIV